MKHRIVWLIVTGLTVAAVVLSSCKSTTSTTTTTTTTSATGTLPTTATSITTTAATTTVATTAGMVIDPSTGQLVKKPEYGGTITSTRGSDVSYFDPWRDQDGAGTMGQYYEVLFQGNWAAPRSEVSFKGTYWPEKYTVGSSAESFENPDPLTYIIHLRQGMHFWDKAPVNGREVTADDVKFCIDRILGLGEFAKAGKSPYVSWIYWSNVTAVDVVDKYTFTLHLKTPNALFPEQMGGERMPFIYPRELFDTYGKQWTWQQVVGSGPWILSDYVVGSSITYIKNPTYFGHDEKFPQNQIPYADYNRSLIIPDWTTTLAALRTGKIDILGVGWQDAQTLQKTDPQLKHSTVADVAYVLDVRNDQPPFNDIRVRKAMQMALPLKDLAEQYFGGTASPNPYLINSVAYPEYFTPLDQFPQDVQDGFAYNPEGAIKLLAEAGYPSGFQMEMPMTGPSDLADLAIGYWQAIGIKTNQKVMDGANYYAYVYSGRKHQCAWNYLSGYWMPTECLNFVAYGAAVPWNYGNVNDPVFNNMLDSARQEPDPTKRNQLIKDTAAYGFTQFYAIMLPQQTGYIFWNPWLGGYNGENDTSSYGRWAENARWWIDQSLKKK